MTINEIEVLKEETLHNLIKSNRELKINYQTTKEHLNLSKQRMNELSRLGINSIISTDRFESHSMKLIESTLSKISLITNQKVILH